MIKLTKTQRGISAVEVVAALIIVGGLAWKFYPSGGMPAIFKKPLAEQYKICRDDFTQKIIGSVADSGTLQRQNIAFVKICMERAGLKINETFFSRIESEKKLRLLKIENEMIEMALQRAKERDSQGIIESFADLDSARDLYLFSESISVNAKEFAEARCYLGPSLECWQD